MRVKMNVFFWMDNVDGALHFGNGIHGMILPYGSNNVLVDLYYEVPGKYGNVGKGKSLYVMLILPYKVTIFSGNWRS